MRIPRAVSASELVRALRLVHESGKKLAISEATIRKLHKLSRGDIWDAGRYKEKDVDIIQTYPDGRSRVRFRSVPAKQIWNASAPASAVT